MRGRYIACQTPVHVAVLQVLLGLGPAVLSAVSMSLAPSLFSSLCHVLRVQLLFIPSLFETTIYMVYELHREVLNLSMY